MADTLSTLAAGIKTYYTRDRVKQMGYKKHALFAMLPKNEKVGGNFLAHPLHIGNAQGVHNTFTGAAGRASATSTQLKQWNVYHASEYSLAEIDGKALRRVQNSPEAMLDLASQYIDGAIDSLTRRLATLAYRSGFGAVGTIGSISTNTITLANKPDAANFEVGQQVVFSQSESGHTLRNTGGTTTLTITGINVADGILTFATNVSTVTGTTAGDTVFLEGDRQDSATPARLVMTGIEGWVPQTAPTSGDSFHGVDRTAYIERLAGSRWDARGYPAEEVLTEMCSRVAAVHGTISDIFCNPKWFNQLTKSMGARVTYNEFDVEGVVGFRGVKVNGATGDVRVVPDFNCPADRVYGLNLDDLELFSTGPAIRMIDDDSNEFLRLSDADKYQVRFIFDGNLLNKQPINHINVRVTP